MLYLSPSVREKLKKRNITEAHLLQCFANREGRALVDDREEHRTNPPTRWFVASTDYGLMLKVCYVHEPERGILEIKTAYPATEEVTRIYRKYALKK